MIFTSYYYSITKSKRRSTFQALESKIQKYKALIPSLDFYTLRVLHLLNSFHTKTRDWKHDLPELQDVSKEFLYFDTSKLGDYLDEFIYFLFLKDVEKNWVTPEGITVHYKQGKRAVLCLDERYVFSHWGNHKGLVSLTKNILLLQFEEVIILNTNKFKEFSKKNTKMHYLRKFINHFSKDYKQREEYYDDTYF